MSPVGTIALVLGITIPLKDLQRPSPAKDDWILSNKLFTVAKFSVTS